MDFLANLYGYSLNISACRSSTCAFWQAWDEDSPPVLKDEDFQGCEDEEKDKDSVL